MKRLTYINIILLLLSFVFFKDNAHAGVDIIQPLHFGEMIVRNNNAAHTVTINTDGSYSFSPGLVELSAPQEGIYDITGLPINTVVASVVITQIQPLTGVGNFFTMNAFQTLFTNTDPLGVSMVTVGATAQTTGSSVPYINQTYTGQLQIQINF